MRLNTNIRSIAVDVHKWVKKQRPGSIFFLQDIPVAGSDVAIRKIVAQLVKEKEIIRLANGIYVYPKKDPLLGILKPALEEVAIAIARRDNIRLQPAGAFALNKLGLSTQVPMKQVYYTDGTARNIKIGNGSILLVKKSPKRVAQSNYISALVIAALAELGQEQVTQAVKEKIRTAIENEKKEVIMKDALTAPLWIRNIIKELIIPAK